MTERPYAGKNAGQRRAERHAQLTAAGLELLGTVGTSGTTVRSVCQRAGLTSRYFYESFANLDELLVAVFDDLMERTVAKVVAAIGDSDGTIGATIEALGTAFVAMTVDDPLAVRVGFVEAWGSEALMRRRVQTLHDCAHLLAAVIGNDAPTETREQVEVTAFIVVGGLLESILGWLDGSLKVNRETLIQHFTTAAIAAFDRAVS